MRTVARYRPGVPDSFTIARVIAAFTLGALLLAGVVVVGAIVLRFSGRRPGRRWGTAVAALFGFQLGGFFLLTVNDPLQGTAVVAIAGVLALALLWQDRRVQAGAFVSGCAVPWASLWGYYVVLLVTQDADFAPLVTWAMFLAGVVLVAVGLGLMAAGDPLPAEPSPMAAPGQPGSRRFGIVARTVLAPDSIGPLPISEIATFMTEIGAILAVGLIGIPFPLEAVLQIGLATVAGTTVRLVARPPRARRALEAFSWLAEWELRRAKDLTGRGAPMTKSGAQRWVAEVPDEPATRWIRVEMLLWTERFEEARAVAAAMPLTTPYERFEQRFAVDLIDWMAGGHGDPESVSRAADEIDPADEDGRLRATVALALRDSARIAADQGPEAALDPLLRARQVLGSRADNQLIRANWRRSLPMSLAGSIVVWIFFGALS